MVPHPAHRGRCRKGKRIRTLYREDCVGGDVVGGEWFGVWREGYQCRYRCTSVSNLEGRVCWVSASEGGAVLLVIVLCV